MSSKTSPMRTAQNKVCDLYWATMMESSHDFWTFLLLLSFSKEFCCFFEHHKWSAVSFYYVDEIETSLEANKIIIQPRNTDDSTILIWVY